MNKITITLVEYDLIALLHAAAQQSCGYGSNAIEKTLPEFHCCDYNEPIYELVKQIRLLDLEDTDYMAYVEEVKAVAQEDFKERETE
ncbi:hypothetical protein [Jeotgalibaca porci]|uniref:hypothetical protein n=1 Tax=Jeotgalibaca porci TaxID=1868793 RepID=UPI0035A1CB6B